MEDGDLDKFLRSRHREGLPLEMVIDFTQQLLEGLKHMHMRGFMHRDLKPANILIDECQTRQGFMGCGRMIYIADFGLTRQIPGVRQACTKQIATLWYRCPEIMLDNREYSEKVDIWSLGVIIQEMLTGEVTYKGQSELEQLMQIFSEKGMPTSQTFPDYDKYPVLKHIGSMLPVFKNEKAAE
jgi:serine/threonine protein kinase